MHKQENGVWAPVEETGLVIPGEDQVRNIFDMHWGPGIYDRWKAQQSAELLKSMADDIAAEMPNAPSLAQAQRMRYFVGYLTAAAEMKAEGRA